MIDWLKVWARLSGERHKEDLALMLVYFAAIADDKGCLNFGRFIVGKALHLNSTIARDRLYRLRDLGIVNTKNATKYTFVSLAPVMRSNSAPRKNSPQGKPFAVGKISKYPEWFEKIWEAYPRCVGKQAAFGVCRQHPKKNHPNLVLAAQNYSEHMRRLGTDAQYIKHAATFFGTRGWWSEYVNGLPEKEGGSGKAGRSFKNAGSAEKFGGR